MPSSKTLPIICFMSISSPAYTYLRFAKETKWLRMTKLKEVAGVSFKYMFPDAHNFDLGIYLNNLILQKLRFSTILLSVDFNHPLKDEIVANADAVIYYKEHDNTVTVGDIPLIDYMKSYLKLNDERIDWLVNQSLVRIFH